jgi:hypothetical protein
MRKTVIPLLRDLPPFALIMRCQLCGELVFGGEICKSADEAAECPPRRLLEQVAGAA